MILLDTALVFNYGEEIINNAMVKGATSALLEALTSSPSNEEAMKSTLKLILPQYFIDQPAYDANLADIIVCAASKGYQCPSYQA